MFHGDDSLGLLIDDRLARCCLDHTAFGFSHHLAGDNDDVAVADTGGFIGPPDGGQGLGDDGVDVVTGGEQVIEGHRENGEGGGHGAAQ